MSTNRETEAMEEYLDATLLDSTDQILSSGKAWVDPKNRIGAFNPIHPLSLDIAKKAVGIIVGKQRFRVCHIDRCGPGQQHYHIGIE